jgi:type IV pilus assembly protein PilB
MSAWDRGESARKRLGELLIEAGLIDDAQLALALGSQKNRGGRLGSELIRMGFVDAAHLAHILKTQLGIDWVRLGTQPMHPRTVATVPVEIAVKHTVFPIDYDGKTVTLASTNPADLRTMDAIGFTVGKRIKPVMSLEFEIKRAIAAHYNRERLDALGFVFEEPPEDLDRVIAAHDDYALRHDGRLSEPDAASPSVEAKLDALIALFIEKGMFSSADFSRALDSSTKRTR